MVTSFIADRVMEHRDNNLAAGQHKYRQYFVYTSLYLRFKADVDNILLQDGYGDCIVTE